MLDPVGPFYRHAIKTVIDADAIVSIAKVGCRHVGYLAFFCAFPLFAATAVYANRRRQGAPLFFRVMVAGVLFSLLLIGMSAKLTVDVAGLGPYESLTRNHMRFYLVSLPLLVIAFLLCATHYIREIHRRERLLCAVFFGLYVVGAFVVWANRYGAYWVDAPLLIFAGNRFALYLVVAAGTLAFGLAAVGRKRYAVAAWVLFVLSSGLSSYYLALEYLWTLDTGRLPRVAALIKECLPDKTVGQDVVFIYDAFDVNPFILQYHLGATVKWHQVASSPKEVDCSLVSPYKIVVTFGNLNVSCDFDVLATDGNTRVFRSSKGSRASYVQKDPDLGGLLWKTDCFSNRLSDRETLPTYVLGRKLDFNEEEVGALLGKGWSVREPWGRWTVGTEATLSFRLDQSISSDLQLVIEGHGLVTEKHRQRLVVQVHGQTLAEMTLSPQSQHPGPVIVPRALLGETGILNVTLRTPDAITPKDLGINADTRPLGIGVKSIIMYPENRTGG